MKKLDIAHLNTPIQKMNTLSKQLNKNIYMKRDDYTGTELSGNKIRKIEFLLQYALEQGYDTIITTGALQSNHARATAAVCAMLDLDCYLVLKGDVTDYEGNFFMDYMLGANIHIIAPNASNEVEMEKLDQSLTQEGKRPFLIPVGASNALGSYGYINCYHEIIDQEQQLDIFFDSINVAIGSGGTYAGLWYANELKEAHKRIIGYSVNHTADTFKEEIVKIVRDLDNEMNFNFDTIHIKDQYVGLGYAQFTDEELLFNHELAKNEGIILDPTYTGKAFRGLINEIKQGYYADEENILFIHTGELYGYTKAMRDRMMRLISN